MAAREPMRRPAAQARTSCVVVADAARARVLVLEVDPATGAASELVEISEITNPMLRVRGGAAPSAGDRRGHRTPGHGVVELRDHRRDIERHFAAEIAEEAAAVWSWYPDCELILAAGPAMLGLLRPAIERKTGPLGSRARELARELTRLSPPRLHDELIAAGLVPARGPDAHAVRAAPDRGAQAGSARP